MGLQSAISHLTGTTPNIPTTSHRKWSKYVPSKKVFSAKDGSRTVYLDKNHQVIRILDRVTLEDGTIAYQQVHSDYKGRPCIVDDSSLLMATTCLDGNTPIFDYYLPLITNFK